jgi:hypothetical protein
MTEQSNRVLYSLGDYVAVTTVVENLLPRLVTPKEC